jgi:hypothetical protein
MEKSRSGIGNGKSRSESVSSFSWGRKHTHTEDPDPHLAGLENIRIQNNNSSHPGKLRKAIRFIVLNVQK